MSPALQKVISEERQEVDRRFAVLILKEAHGSLHGDFERRSVLTGEVQFIAGTITAEILRRFEEFRAPLISENFEGYLFDIEKIHKAVRGRVLLA